MTRLSVLLVRLRACWHVLRGRQVVLARIRLHTGLIDLTDDAILAECVIGPEVLVNGVPRRELLASSHFIRLHGRPFQEVSS